MDLISAEEVGMDAAGVDHVGNVICKALRPCKKTISKDVLMYLDADYRPLMDKYLAGLKISPVHSLKELINWNKAHAEKAITANHPQQDRLEKAQNF
jgi:hypothetical protein